MSRAPATLLAGALLVVVFGLAACAPGDRPSSSADPRHGVETHDEVPLANREAPLVVGGCECPAWEPGVTCDQLSYDDIPADDTYYVTTFGGPDEGQEMWICGYQTTDGGTWAYLAGYERFGCGRVRITDPVSGRSCVGQVADCGPNRCVEEAACFCDCAGHHPIVDVSPFITDYLFGIRSSGWSERREVQARLVAPDTPIGCPGGTPAFDAPRLTFDASSEGIAFQNRDFRPEGGSFDVLDLYAGQAIDVVVRIENAADAGAADDAVLGYAVEPPDGALEVTRVAVFAGEPGVAPLSADDTPSAEGTAALGDFPPGTVRSVVFRVRAARYGKGASLRAWMRRVPGWYEEQTAWDDPVEQNGAGTLLRDGVRVDVYSDRYWSFVGAPDETDGWRAVSASTSVVADGGALRATATDGVVRIESPPIVVPTTEVDGLLLSVRADGAPVEGAASFGVDTRTMFGPELPFAVWSADPFAAASVRLGDRPEWFGNALRLRLRFTTTPGAFVRIDELRLTTVAGTTGDADGDGHLAAPVGDDCDDRSDAIHPGAAEGCDGVDDDCDGVTDEGACAACAPGDRDVCRTPDGSPGEALCGTDGQFGPCVPTASPADVVTPPSTDTAAPPAEDVTGPRFDTGAPAPSDTAAPADLSFPPAVGDSGCAAASGPASASGGTAPPPIPLFLLLLALGVARTVSLRRRPSAAGASSG